MDPNSLKNKIETLAPETFAQIEDLTGTEDHYQALIVSPIFQGKSMIEQQRLVMGLLSAELASGEVHALTMKTYTPEQYKKFTQK